MKYTELGNIYLKFPGNFQEISQEIKGNKRKFPGNKKLQGNVIPGNFLGNFLEIFPFDIS